MVHTFSVMKRKGNCCFTMEYQSLLLLLVLAATVFSERSKCPSLEDIYPCQCKIGYLSGDLKFLCKNNKTTLAEVKSALSYFSEEKQIDLIQLGNLNLGTLPSNLFDGFSVKNLNIFKCAIDFEDGELPFKGLEDSLQYLTIVQSFTQKDGPLNLKFGHLKKLEFLMLSNNKIAELGDDLFTNGNSNLHTLVISENGIEKIGEKAFKNLENLKDFDLSGNKFGSLRRNMLPTPADHLEDLRIADNGLFDLPEDIFTSLPSLETVDLQENNIRTLDQNTWETIVEQLSHIYLTGNPLECDSEMEWLFGKEVSRTFWGRCAGPEGKEGIYFDRFLREGKQ